MRQNAEPQLACAGAARLNSEIRVAASAARDLGMSNGSLGRFERGRPRAGWAGGERQ